MNKICYHITLSTVKKKYKVAEIKVIKAMVRRRERYVKILEVVFAIKVVAARNRNGDGGGRK